MKNKKNSPIQGEKNLSFSTFIKKERTNRFSLTLLFSAVVFCVLLVAIAFSMLAVWCCSRFGILGDIVEDPGAVVVMIFVGIISIIIGAGMSVLIFKIPLKPINNLINRMNRLAAGDFSTRLKFGGAISNHPTFIEISDSFNKLAEELENTEMLRSDFINNFSHEFKTPIVSIAGLAKLVNKGNITKEQRMEYLTAIEEESLRLADMATNVLNLTKVENQTILSDITTFNLSEQIRSSVLLLENKWTSKNIELQLDFGEHYIEAGEELLKQVWINITDNAIKFSPRCGTVCIVIDESESSLRVSISNTGSEISPENINKIWNKFYQADESHTTEGNGIGLAVVKKIVELHKGDISVVSQNGMTTFAVELLKKQ
jgi:signal transduction histidine kinase